jgi:hypothetical protein
MGSLGHFILLFLLLASEPRRFDLNMRVKSQKLIRIRREKAHLDGLYRYIRASQHMRYAGSQGPPSVSGRLLARGSIAVNLVFVGSVVVVVLIH